jgi:hypothetical protein
MLPGQDPVEQLPHQASSAQLAAVCEGGRLISIWRGDCVGRRFRLTPLFIYWSFVCHRVWLASSRFPNPGTPSLPQRGRSLWRHSANLIQSSIFD